MSANLTAIFDDRLESALSGFGLKREGVGVYARKASESVWQGVWLVFTEDGSRTRVSPNLALFCPRASKLISDILAKLYGKAAGYGYSKLGRPFVSAPLYSLVVERCAMDRHSFDYDVEEEDDVMAITELICDDFLRVSRLFFNGTTTAEELRDRIASHPISASSGIDAMTLTYLTDKNVSLDELERYAGMSQNAMTREFTIYLKTKIIEERGANHAIGLDGADQVPDQADNPCGRPDSVPVRRAEQDGAEDGSEDHELCRGSVELDLRFGS